MRSMRLFDSPRREGPPYRLLAGAQKEIFHPLEADWIRETEEKKGGERL